MLDGLVTVINRSPKIAPISIAAAPTPRNAVSASPNTFPNYRGLLVGLLVGGVLVVGGLTFFPTLALCSVAGHLTLRYGLFVGLLVGFALIVGGLAFAPAITLGPIAGNSGTPGAALS